MLLYQAQSEEVLELKLPRINILFPKYYDPLIGYRLACALFFHGLSAS